MEKLYDAHPVETHTKTLGEPTMKTRLIPSIIAASTLILSVTGAQAADSDADQIRALLKNYERCRRGLEEFEAANLLVTDRQADVSGRLRISVPPSLSGSIFMPLIEAFRLLHPKTLVHCLVTDRHVDHIADGIDLSVRVGELKDSSLVARRLLRSRSVLVASPGYLKRRGEPAHPNELAEHCLVAFSRWDTTVSWTLARGDDIQKITIEPKIATNDYLGVQKAVADGQGISEIPLIVCGEGLKDGRLVEVMPSWQFVPVTIAAVYPSNRNLSRAVRLFRDYLVEQFEIFAPHAKTA